MKAIIVVAVSIFFLTSCIRLNEGEDTKLTNDIEEMVILKSIRYIKDENKGLCFAVLNNHTDGFRSTFTLAHVDCDKIN